MSMILYSLGNKKYSRSMPIAKGKFHNWLGNICFFAPVSMVESWLSMGKNRARNTELAYSMVCIDKSIVAIGNVIKD